MALKFCFFYCMYEPQFCIQYVCIYMCPPTTSGLGLGLSPTFLLLVQSGAQVCVRKETGDHSWNVLGHHGVVHCWPHCQSSECYLKMHHP